MFKKFISKLIPGASPSADSGLMINGESATAKAAGELMSHLSDPLMLRRNGGILFKYLNHENVHHFGLIPCLIDGERGYHYTIKMREASPLTLVGSIDPSGLFRVLFIPASTPLDPGTQEAYRSQYSSFCCFMKDHGFRGEARLDDITLQLLQEAELFDSLPRTLYQTLPSEK